MTGPALKWPAGPPVLSNAALAEYSYFRIGGPAEYLATAESAKQLVNLLNAAHHFQLAITMLGEASNVLIGDDGIAGLVIVNRARQLTIGSNARIVAESGVLMGQLARTAARANISGFEFAVGIPGTVGGSVWGNAGCFGSDMAAILEQALLWRPSGTTNVAARDLGFGYRHCSLQSEASPVAIIKAQLIGNPGELGDIQRAMQSISARRRASQPADRSAGSIFKNPPGAQAGQLIEAADLKGRHVGGAVVSSQHANFIVNDGGASAADVAALMGQIIRRVAEVSGFQLQPEIRRLGTGFGTEHC